MNTRFILTTLLVCISVFLTSCKYKVSITSKPTSKIDNRLIDDWVSKDQKDNLKIRMLNESEYIVSLNGSLARAFHSDIDTTRFVNIQDIDNPKGPGTYTFVSYTISEDSKQLVVKIVDDKTIPYTTRSSEEVAALLKQHMNVYRHQPLFRVDARLPIGSGGKGERQDNRAHDHGSQ